MIEETEESVYICNSIAGLMETAFDIMSYNTNVSNTNHNLLSNDGRVFFTDNYFFDNDGVACEVFFGNGANGSVGYDDRYKSGSMQVRMTKYYSNLQNKIIITFNTPDKLTFHKQVIKDVFEPMALIGLIEMTRLTDTRWFYETKNLTINSEDRELEVELAGYIDLIDGRIEGFLDNEYGITFTGNFNDEYAIRSTLETKCTKDFEEECSQNFSMGSWVIENKAGDVGKLDFDAFQDASCDPFAKLTWGSKEELVKLH